MPSGPKKRKSARKKMKIHLNDQPNTYPASVSHNGDDDLEQVDEIERKEEIGKLGDASNPSQVVVVEGDCELESKNESRSGDEKDGSSSKCSSGSSNSSSESDSDEESDDAHSSVDTPVDYVTQIEDLSDAVVEEPPPMDSNTSLSVKEEERDTSSPVHETVSSYLVESLSEEDEKPCPVEDKTSISVASTDRPSDNEQTIVQYMEKTITIADHNQYTTKEIEDRLRFPHCELKADADNSAEYEKTYQAVEHLVAPVPRPLQTTSWKSCCGLFDVFTGSGR